MSATLNTDPMLVREYPVAVSVTETDGTVIYTHFKSKPAAALFAGLFPVEAVKRFVATSFDQTWREVTYFV